MKDLAVLWRWLRPSLRRVHLALAVRITVAAILSLVAAQQLGLPLPLWAVLTAMIVTQMSVGRSLKATSDYLAGTVGGAIYGALVAVLIPHESELALLAVLVIAVAPLALLAAGRPNMNVVPITAIIILLLPGMTHASPVASAINRVLEVALGAVIGLGVSFVVLPSSAHRQMRQAAARILGLMARAQAALIDGLRRGLDTDELHRLQDGIGQGLNDLNTIAVEAERERKARLSSEADTGPLRRTLLRLRHDLVIVGRAASTPLPEALAARLESRLDEVARTASTYLRGCSAALLAQAGPPPIEAFERALAAYEKEVEAARADGLTRVLPADGAERFFAVGFALEQMRQNLLDLQRVVEEWGPKDAGD
ncbi:MAG: FUSC family protein [Proteobacteria bacterium]|nr:FUSC family protein [Pseudomonadota bacterium]